MSVPSHPARGGRGSNQYQTRGTPTPPRRVSPPAGLNAADDHHEPDEDEVAWVFHPAYRTWKDIGPPPWDQAAPWIEAGLNHEEFDLWVNVNGFNDFAEVQDWMNHNVFVATEARDWKTRGFAPADIAEWRSHWGPELAVIWKAEGFTAATAAPWSQSRFKPEHAAVWRAAGFTADVAVNWKRAGFAPSDAKAWTDEGVDVARATEWRDTNGLNHEQSRRWRDRGLSPNQTARLTIAGYSDPATIPPLEIDWQNNEDADLWFGCGVASVFEVNAWYDVGVVHPYEAQEWRDAMWGPGETKQWIAAGIADARTAIAYEQEGFEPGAAREWLYAGISPTDAADHRERGTTVEQVKARQQTNRTGRER